MNAQSLCEISVTLTTEQHLQYSMMLYIASMHETCAGELNAALKGRCMARGLHACIVSSIPL